MSKIVVALGGNALQNGKEARADQQEAVAKQTIKQIMPLVKAGNEIVIVHGNGPQVGNIILHEESINTEATPTMPLHACVGMTQGMIGYWLQKALLEEFQAENLKKDAVAIVTQIEVSKNDPAFENPSKPIGPFYTEEEARAAEAEKGYIVKEDSGRGWRRVVPSPKPIDIIEISTIDKLLKNGAVVIAAGGGGIPVERKTDGSLSGVDAIIDKDFAAELLAEKIGADTLLILTAVDYAAINFGKENQTELKQISLEEAKKHIADGQFAAGSMLPKVEACVKFAEFGGKAIITSLKNAQNAISNGDGTIIVE